MRIATIILAASLGAASAASAVAGPSFPKYVTLPALPIDAGSFVKDEHGEGEFALRGSKETHRGRVWLGYLDYSRWKADRRAALEGIVESLRKGGWEVMLLDAPANPPIATLKIATKDNKVAWARVEVDGTARVLILEPTDD